jgi:hypothetical protein
MGSALLNLPSIDVPGVCVSRRAPSAEIQVARVVREVPQGYAVLVRCRCEPVEEVVRIEFG